MKALLNIAFGLIIFQLIPPQLSAVNHDKIIVFSEETGAVIDSVENLQFDMFPDINGYKRSVIAETPDNYRYAWIRYSRGGQLRDTIIWLTPQDVISISNRLTGNTTGKQNWKYVEKNYIFIAESLRRQDEYIRSRDSLRQTLINNIRAERSGESKWDITTYDYVYENMSLNELTGDTLIAAGGSCEWLIPVNDIDKIHYDSENKFSNALLGAVTGLIGGVIIGHIIGRNYTDGEDLNSIYISTSLGGLLGASSGLFIGAAFSDDRTYRLTGKSTPKKRKIIREDIMGEE